jgi:hypothetical protein
MARKGKKDPNATREIKLGAKQVQNLQMLSQQAQQAEMNARAVRGTMEAYLQSIRDQYDVDAEALPAVNLDPERSVLVFGPRQARGPQMVAEVADAPADA